MTTARKKTTGRPWVDCPMCDKPGTLQPAWARCKFCGGEHDVRTCRECHWDPTRVPIHAYYKQGDDFRSCLEEAKDNVPKALVLWADRLEDAAQRLRSLSLVFASTPKRAEGEGNTHHVEIRCSDEAAVHMALKAWGHTE